MTKTKSLTAVLQLGRIVSILTIATIVASCVGGVEGSEETKSVIRTISVPMGDTVLTLDSALQYVRADGDYIWALLDSAAFALVENALGAESLARGALLARSDLYKIQMYVSGRASPEGTMDTCRALGFSAYYIDLDARIIYLRNYRREHTTSAFMPIEALSCEINGFGCVYHEFMSDSVFTSRETPVVSVVDFASRPRGDYLMRRYSNFKSRMPDDRNQFRQRISQYVIDTRNRR